MAKVTRQFSLCCGVPLDNSSGTPHCGVCKKQCEVVDEVDEYFPKHSDFLPDFDLLNPPVVNPFTVLEFIDNGRDIRIAFAKDGEVGDVTLPMENLISWGQHEYWHPVINRGFTDPLHNEYYEQVWRIKPFTREYHEEGLASVINERRKNKFIESLTKDIIALFLRDNSVHITKPLHHAKTTA